MRYCTLFRDEGGTAAEFIGCDAVDDAHRYGLSADGKLWHVAGVRLPQDRTVVFGMARGKMTDLYPELTPCGHPEGTPDAR